jgi:hypothetical protein
MQWALLQGVLQTGTQFLSLFGSLVNPILQVQIFGDVQVPFPQEKSQTGWQCHVLLTLLENPLLQTHLFWAMHCPLVQGGLQIGTQLVFCGSLI